MSQRAIVEISHDWLTEIERNPLRFTEALMRAIRNSRDGDDLLLTTSYGARVVARRHHSEDVEAKIGIRTVKWG